MTSKVRRRQLTHHAFIAMKLRESLCNDLEHAFVPKVWLAEAYEGEEPEDRVIAELKGSWWVAIRQEESSVVLFTCHSPLADGLARVSAWLRRTNDEVLMGPGSAPDQGV